MNNRNLKTTKKMYSTNVNGRNLALFDLDTGEVLRDFDEDSEIVEQKKCYVDNIEKIEWRKNKKYFNREEGREMNSGAIYTYIRMFTNRGNLDTSVLFRYLSRTEYSVLMALIQYINPRYNILMSKNGLKVLTLKDISELLDIEKGNLSRTMNKLMKLGLVGKDMVGNNEEYIGGYCINPLLATASIDIPFMQVEWFSRYGDIISNMEEELRQKKLAKKNK